MQPFNRAIMTDAGSSLFMRAQAGELKIQFTKVAVGDGTYSEEERKIASQQIQTELKSQKNSYPLSKIEVVSDHSVKVTAIITNYDPLSEAPIVENGYYINEMGLFAKEYGSEDDETEILYSIAIVQSETGDFMPPYDGNNPAQIIQEYYATVSNSEDVTIETGKGAVALAEDVEKLKALDFDDSGEIEGIESFIDFMSAFVTNTGTDQLFANLKAGLNFVLHMGMLVNNGTCETPGQFALDAAYGKTLTDMITGLYSDIEKYKYKSEDTLLEIIAQAGKAYKKTNTFDLSNYKALKYSYVFGSFSFRNEEIIPKNLLKFKKYLNGFYFSNSDGISILFGNLKYDENTSMLNFYLDAINCSGGFNMNISGIK